MTDLNKAERRPMGEATKVAVIVLVGLFLIAFLILVAIPQTRCGMTGETWVSQVEADRSNPLVFAPMIPAHCQR